MPIHAILWLAATAAAAPNPLTMPGPAELSSCVPAGAQGKPTPAQRRAVIACAQTIVARQINSRTPVAVDSATTLVSASASGPTLQYNYRINADATEFTPKARSVLTQELTRGTRASVCGNADMRRTIANGGSYGYAWTDRTGRPIHKILIQRCG